MDGVAWFKIVAARALPEAAVVVVVWFLGHVVRLAGDALDRCRQCLQKAAPGHRVRSEGRLRAARRALHTRESCSPRSSMND